MFQNPWWVALILNTVLVAAAAIAPKKLLTPWGYGHGWLLGVLVWGCFQGPGYGVVMFYFLVGTAITKVKMAEKEAAGIAEKRGGLRSWENVWGSALVATLCALASVLVDEPGRSLLALGYVASFSTKLSDTTASEIGKAYGKTTYLITTLKPVARGTEGAVSLEGTLAGFGASLVLALVGYGFQMITLGGVLWCVIAAFGATNLESVIGATLQERWQWLTNELVNVINTFCGAAIAMALAWIFTGP